MRFRNLIAFVAVAVTASAAMAQPYYARGDFNGWGLANPLVDAGGGMFSTTLTGLTPGLDQNLKAADELWTVSAPGSNGLIPANSLGEISLNFFPATTWSDGWEPSAKARLGWVDPGAFGWEVIGSLNGWAGGDLMADMGNGLYVADITLAAGTYDFKFREQGSWAHNIGDDSGNSAANNSVTVANNGDTVRFSLDLPNGRWQTTTLVPEPASLALMGLGGLMMIRRR